MNETDGGDHENCPLRDSASRIGRYAGGKTVTAGVRRTISQGRLWWVFYVWPIDKTQLRAQPVGAVNAVAEHDDDVIDAVLLRPRSAEGYK